jgi:OFA family oxalate/formate antiporter-like MFS transporter
VIAGAGIGTAYICPLATCVKWFPERKGLITGLAVAGYGAGAIVLSALSAALFARGWNVLEIFRLVGIAYGTVVLLCALVLSVPEGCAGAAPVGEKLAARKPLSLGTQREFWGLAAGIFCGTFAGALVIGNLKTLGLHAGLSPAVATAAISVLAVGNASGRLSWGGVHDRWGARVLPISLVFLAAAVLGMLGLGRAPGAFLPLALAVGLGYGAALVVYVAQAAQVWGAGRLGRVYPFVMLFHGAGALVGPALAGALLDRSGSFAPALIMGGAVALAGAVAVAAILSRVGA